jgi:integrase
MLTEKQIRAIQPGEKIARYYDGHGLCLEVKPSGGKYWRYRYRFGGKQKTLALGVYPATSLKSARVQHADARAKLTHGVDPMMERRRERLETGGKTFQAVAEEWLTMNRRKWSETYYKDNKLRLAKNIFPFIGSRPINIPAVEVLEVMRKMERRGVNETAHKVLALCSQVFRFAVASCLIPSDPTRDLRGALAPVIKGRFAAITDEQGAGELMRAIGEYHGTALTGIALCLHAYTFCRPGEIRHAEWVEVSFEDRTWIIPASKMKMKRDHLVPLSRQAETLFRQAWCITGDGRYVFPSIRTPTRPMSENTVNCALRRLGYEKHEMTAHGFRSMASTLLNEKHDFSSDVIERQLAHVEGNKIRAAYHRAAYLEERTRMMQVWADYLDELAK